MSPVDSFGWIVTILLGISFICSLIVLSEKTKLLSENKKEESSQMNK